MVFRFMVIERKIFLFLVLEIDGERIMDSWLIIYKMWEKSIINLNCIWVVIIIRCGKRERCFVGNVK